MCRRASRLVGVRRHAEPAKPPLLGAAGMALVEYRGEKEGRLPKSAITQIAYPYHPGRKFYVDKQDLSRVLAWTENGAFVFLLEDDGAGTTV